MNAIRRPTVRKCEILATSATFGQAFAIIDDGKGHREPARIQCSHALSFEHYRKLRNTPLKEVAHPQPELGGEHPDAPHEMLWQKARQQPPPTERQRRIAALQTLLVSKQALESGDKCPASLF